MSAAPRRAIAWFRSDLRITDNRMLASATRLAERVWPVFVADPTMLAKVLEAAGLPASAVSALAGRTCPFDAWTTLEQVRRADRVRAALVALADEVRGDALRTIAREGALGYDELLLAATELCRNPPPALAARYDALLVDELQDTNPAQLAFYEAFAAMRKKDPIATFFVGDARQADADVLRARMSGCIGHSLAHELLRVEMKPRRHGHVRQLV